MPIQLCEKTMSLESSSSTWQVRGSWCEFAGMEGVDLTCFGTFLQMQWPVDRSRAGDFPPPPYPRAPFSNL